MVSSMSFSPTKFCILTTQRSGSTWLNDLLSNHPQVYSFDEPFHYPHFYPFFRKDQGVPNYLLYQNLETGYRPKLTFQYMDVMNSFSGLYPAVGFKLMYGQLFRFPEIMVKMIKDRYLIVHLIRSNLLDIELSGRKALKVKKFHSSEIMPQIKVRLDPDTIIGKLRKIRLKILLAKAILRVSPLKSIEVEYENLVNNHEKTIMDILQFFSVPVTGIELISSYKKQSKGSYKDKIENYDEIVQVLENSKFAYLIPAEK